MSLPIRLLLLWLVAQLLFIGTGAVSIHNDLVDGKFDCTSETRDHVPIWFGALFPLLAFTGPIEDKHIDQVCGVVK